MQRIFLVLFTLTAGVLLLAAVWVIVTGLIARSRLNAVKDELPQLRAAVSSGDLGAARALADTIAQQTGSAHQLTSGPAWWVAANLPGIGTPFSTGRVVAYQSDRIGSGALPGVLRLTAAVIHSSGAHSNIDLASLAAATRGVGSASDTVHSASLAIDDTAPSWLPLVSNSRSDVVTDLHNVDAELRTAHRTLLTVLPMLGQDRPQRYFLGFMNEAESRGLGGIPGAFAIITVDHGKVAFTHFGSDDDLHHVRADIPLTKQYRALYGQDDPTGIFQNSDLSPHFPDAARIWAALWQRKSGEHVDGAIAIDPSAIGYLLGATGPATLPNGSKVTARNVVALTQQRQYSLYGGTTNRAKTERKDFLISIAKAVADQALVAPSVRGIAGAAQRAVHERRLVVWSANPTYEATIVRFGLGGVLDAGDRPFSAFVSNNAAGSKMDYYIESTMNYHRSSCAAGATSTATLRLTNDTPSYRLPPYVTIVLGGKPPGVRPGFTRVIVAYYATPGSTVRSVLLDGRKQIVASAPERGLTTVRLLVNLPANATRTLTVTTTEPAAHGPVQILRQPSVRPIAVTVHAPNCN